MRSFESLENRHMMTAGLVRDFVEINAGTQNVWGESIKFDGVLFYSYGDNTSGTELWRTDGTNEGTFLVKDIVPGNEGSVPRNAIAIGDKFVFEARTDVSQADFFQGSSIWASDGTAAGTVQLLDESWHSPHRLGDRVLFLAGDDDALWETDGTPTGTQRIDFPSPVSSLVRQSDESLLIRHDTSLSRIDQDLETVEITSDLGEFIREIGTVGSDKFLYAQPSSFAEFSFFTTNDILVLDLNTGESTELLLGLDGFPDGRNTLIGDHTFFTSAENVFAENEDRRELLWKTDGTTDGTIQIPTDSEFISSLTTVGDTVYFSTRDENQATLWSVEEASSSADVVLQESHPRELLGPRLLPIGNLEDSLYVFDIVDSVLWEVTEGEATEFISDELDFLNLLGEIDGRLFFAANDGVHGYELWTYDRDSGETQLVIDANQSTGSSFAAPLGTLNGRMIVSALPTEPNNTLDFINSEADLLAFDGTDFTRIGGAGFNPSLNFKILGERAVYWRVRVDDGERFLDLWSTDGTEAGTSVIYESNLTTLVTLGDLDVIDDVFYFQEADRTNWRSDGTEEGTFQVDALPEIENETKTFPIEGGEYLVERADDGSEKIWFSDDSPSSLAAQVRLVAELPPFSQPEFLTIGSKLIVETKLVDDSGFGATVTIQAIDASTGEVVKLGGDFPRPQNVSSFDTVGQLLAKLDDLVYFVGDDPFSGKELWVSDGTAAGTTIYDLWPGVSSSEPSNLLVFQDELYFSAADEAHGHELWKVSGEKPVAGDFNQDGDVNIHDFIFMTTNFLKDGASRLEGDIDGDGTVGFSDFLILQDNFGHRGDPPVTQVG